MSIQSSMATPLRKNSKRRGNWQWLLSASLGMVVLQTTAGCVPQPYIVEPSDGGAICCKCDGPCFVEVCGTLTSPLGPNQELFLVIRPVDEAAPRYFVQFAQKTVNETLWTAVGQLGSDDFPPQAGDSFEIWAIVVNSRRASLPVEPLPDLTRASIPALLAVSDNFSTVSVDCSGVLCSLANYTYWHLYSPFREAAGTLVSQDQITRELQMLFDAGARGLVTYEMMNGIEKAPRIAKEIGFRWVIAGVYWWTNGVANGQTESTLSEEKANLDSNVEWIDGIVIGNEGLVESSEWNQPRYAFADLERELGAMKAKYPARPVTTAEGRIVYEGHPNLVSDGSLTDFIFPNLHPWWGGFRDPVEGVNDVILTLASEPFASRGNRLLVLHESWWPSETDGQTEDAQAAFFQGLLDAGIPFCWGETIDQPWKGGPEGAVGAHWGLWHYDSAADVYRPKKVVDLVKANSSQTVCDEI